MARSRAPLRLALTTLVCAAVTAAPLPPVVRIVGALPLVLYLPGRCCLAAAFPGRTVDGETRVLSAALSLALVTLLGPVLAGVSPLGSRPWLAGLSTLCVAACVIAAVGGRGTQTRVDAAAVPPLGPFRLLSLVIALGLAGFAYLNASRGALGQRPDLYTDFWVVPDSGQAPAIATAGVKNQEGRDAIYAIDVVARGSVVERQEAFRLHSGETRLVRVSLPRVVFAPAGQQRSLPTSDRSQAIGLRTPDDALGRDRVELRLFKDGDRDVAYRRVWIALPAPLVTPSDPDAADLPAGDLAYSGSAVKTLRASLRAERPAGSQASSLAPNAATRPGIVRDTTHALDLSQAAALQAPAFADTRHFGVAPDDAITAMRSPRFSPGPSDPATTSISPE